MSDPYEILGVSPQADLVEIRRRYLELVRESPPDREPERFAAIRAAYDEVRDPARRLNALIFEPGTHDSLDALIAELRGRLASARLSVEALLSLAEAP